MVFERNNRECSVEIRKVPYTEAPIELLLEADPSVEKIKAYLPGSSCFVAMLEGKPVGACVVQCIAPAVYELMSIAVAPEYQRQGIGSKLLRHVVTTVRDMGARRLEVGTGTFGYQLAWYQREGFRVFAIDRDFFLVNYKEPIYENGIQLQDMLRLAVEY
ncbi:GNAT family N-acetyltransferase [candidate division KSB1 bacterium]|nr:GNAT family N-acetyltransferase [candidate division KSB1 bacterium]